MVLLLLLFAAPIGDTLTAPPSTPAGYTSQQMCLWFCFTDRDIDNPPDEDDDGEEYPYIIEWPHFLLGGSLVLLPISAVAAVGGGGTFGTAYLLESQLGMPNETVTQVGLIGAIVMAIGVVGVVACIVVAATSVAKLGSNKMKRLGERGASLRGDDRRRVAEQSSGQSH